MSEDIKSKLYSLTCSDNVDAAHAIWCPLLVLGNGATRLSERVHCRG